MSTKAQPRCEHCGQLIPTRGKLRALLRRYPQASAADAARSLGVSRQRVHQIAHNEGLEFRKREPVTYPMDEEFLGVPTKRRHR